MDTIRAGPVLIAGLILSDLAINDLWLRYFALTGRHSRDELMAYLQGGVEWSRHEHDVAAQALNEYFVERGMDHPVSSAHEL